MAEEGYGSRKYFKQETQETQVQSSGREEPLEEEIATPTPVFLLGESHGQKSLAVYRLWGHKESDMTEPLRLRLQQKTIAYYLNI